MKALKAQAEDALTELQDLARERSGEWNSAAAVIPKPRRSLNKKIAWDALSNALNDEEKAAMLRDGLTIGGAEKAAKKAGVVLPLTAYTTAQADT